jgi:excisionase family DNA binding protein
MDVYYTIKQVADKVSVHPDTIRKLVSNGKMEAVKFGGAIRISESAVTNYLERFKVQKPLPPKPVVATSPRQRLPKKALKYLR